MLNYLVFIDCNLKTSVNFSEIITLSDHASKTECKHILINNDVKTQHLLVFRLPLSKNGPFGTIQTTITTIPDSHLIRLPSRDGRSREVDIVRLCKLILNVSVTKVRLVSGLLHLQDLLLD